MTKNTRFSPEVRQRAIRMVLESQDEYDSQWAAICSIAPKIGCTRRLCVSGFASMSGIPGAVMVGSPPLNVSV
ncbi:IS1203 transposase orfA [Escherichia coli]|nr:IS1203 transposase orfA [Escherichia coli]